MSGGNCNVNIQHSSFVAKQEVLDSETPHSNPQEFISKNFSEEELEVLKCRRDFVDAMSAIKTLGDAEAVFEFGRRLLKEGIKLQDVDYATVLMFAIRQLTITVVLADYSVVHFKYETEAELARDLQTWTNGDRAKLHIPGTHAEPQSVGENPAEDPIESPAGDD